jgi:hypothetical protein
MVEIARTAVDQEDVHPSVVIVIEERATGARCLREIAVIRPCILVNPGNAAPFRRNREKDVAMAGFCCALSETALIWKKGAVKPGSSDEFCECPSVHVDNDLSSKSLPTKETIFSWSSPSFVKQ